MRAHDFRFCTIVGNLATGIARGYSYVIFTAQFLVTHLKTTPLLLCTLQIMYHQMGIHFGSLFDVSVSTAWG